MGLGNLVLLPVIASIGFSCQLERKKKGEPVEVTDNAKTEKEAKVDQVTTTSHGAIPLDIWPADTSMLISMDVTTIRRSPLRNIFDGIVRKAETGFLPNTTACQRQLLDSVSAMLLIDGMIDSAKRSVGVVRGMKRSEVEACVAKEATETAQGFGANYGALGDDIKKYLVWWLDSETLLISPDGGKQAIDLARPNKVRAPTNPELMESLTRVDTSAAIWVAAVDTKTDTGSNFGEFRGSIQLKDGLNASFRVHYDTKQNAEKASSDLTSVFQSVTPFAKYFSESKTRTEGSLLLFDLSMPSSQLQQFVNEPMIAGMFPKQ